MFGALVDMLIGAFAENELAKFFMTIMHAYCTPSACSPREALYVSPGLASCHIELRLRWRTEERSSHEKSLSQNRCQIRGPSDPAYRAYRLPNLERRQRRFGAGQMPQIV